jgi:cyclase
MRRRSLIGILALFAVPVCLPAQQNQNYDTVQVRVLPVQGNVFMLVGAGGNVTLQTGKDAILLVDASFEPMADKIMAAAKTQSDKDLQWVINTHVHDDHTGGNAKLRKMGKTIAGGNVAGDIKDSMEGATIIAQQNVLDRLSGVLGKDKPAPQDAWPTDTYSTPHKDLFINGEAIQIFHMPHAHTDGDSIVHFRKSDVIVAGDIFTPETYPVIDIDRGGTVQGLIDALNRIIEIAVPERSEEGGTRIIPGHGRICDEIDVVEYRDMLTIVRDRFQDMIRKGYTLAQVEAANPTSDYDPYYGRTSGFWTTKMFQEAVYRSLTQSKQ